MRKKIALIIAMREEAKPLIEKLNLTPDSTFGDPKLPFQYYTGVYSKGETAPIELLLSLNGQDARSRVDNIGTEPATLNAYVTLNQFKPDLCINAGTAGGFQKRGARIGDVYLSTEAFRFHDRRIPIPGFEEYGIGNFPAFSIPKMADALGLKSGVVTTGNSLDCSDLDWKMMEKTNGSVKEMEAAGIAWVAHLLGVPLVALKAVTDFVDHPEPSGDQFLRNLSHASKSLQTKTLEVLRYLEQHPQLW